MGSGGHNRVHEITDRYRQLDSFTFAECRGHIETLYGRIQLDFVPCNYGGYRAYFICPNCSRRVRYLYLRRSGYECRTCAELNYYRQQIRTADLCAYKMRKMLREKFKIDGNLSPHEMSKLTPERPRGMHWNTYSKLLAKWRELQREDMRIFCGAWEALKDRLGQKPL